MRPYCVVVVYKDGSLDAIGPFKSEETAERYKRERPIETWANGEAIYVRMLLARS